MAEAGRSLQEAADLMRHCLESGEVVPGKHFRDELANDNLDMADALTVLKSGAIYDAPEVDIRTGTGNIAWKAILRIASGLRLCFASSQRIVLF
jgi:hypothetical protein